MPGQIRAFVFDVFGTVVDWREGVARELVASGLVPGADRSVGLRFADAWRRLYAPAFMKVNRGERPFVKLDVLHMENLLAILPEFGVDPSGLAPEQLERLNAAWRRLPPWPDSVEGLARLKTRYIVAPHSNGNLRLLLEMAKHGGLPWDAILGAEVVGAYKPTPHSYLRTAELLSLQPHEVCMTAAHNDDLQAARACGLRTAFIYRRTEYGPEQRTDLQPAADWDFIAESITDLATQAGCA